jgi:hypothetical protein
MCICFYIRGHEVRLDQTELNEHCLASQTHLNTED